jgi:hypothetical protein
VRPERTMSRLHALLVASLLALSVAGAAFAASSDRSIASTVRVTFTDASLRVSPTTPSSGPTTFLVRNNGKKAHVLVVKGPGVKGARTGKIPAGSVGKLSVTLRPGAYVLSDPIGLGEYNVTFLDVLKAVAVGGKGDARAVAPEVQLPPMCGEYYTP